MEISVSVLEQIHLIEPFSEKWICRELLTATSGAFGHTIDASDLTFDGHCRWHIQATVNNTVELKILKIFKMQILNYTGCNEFLKVGCL